MRDAVLCFFCALTCLRRLVVRLRGFLRVSPLVLPCLCIFHYWCILDVRRETAPPLSVVLVLVGGLEDRATDFCRLVEGTCGVFSALRRQILRQSTETVEGARCPLQPAVMCSVSGPLEEPVSLCLDSGYMYYERTDGNVITVDAKRFRCAEVFFQPDGLATRLCTLVSPSLPCVCNAWSESGYMCVSGGSLVEFCGIAIAITALKGLAGFTLGFNVIANCSNTTVYVGFTFFASCCALPDLILPSLHLHGGVYFNTFLRMLVMSVFALGCDVRASTSRSSGVIR